MLSEKNYVMITNMHLNASISLLQKRQNHFEIFSAPAAGFLASVIIKQHLNG